MAMRSVMVGTRAPSFTLLCTGGPGSEPRRVSLDDYLDRWLLLLFYARDFSLI
jgi:alkyl hydroperoxide reductase subunit AhpC